MSVEFDLDTSITFADGVQLDGVVERIAVPFLIAQVPGPSDSVGLRPPLLRPGHHQSAPRAAHLHAEEGSTEHIGLDHLQHVSTFIADWVAKTFAESS